MRHPADSGRGAERLDPTPRRRPQAIDGHHLAKNFRFKDFCEALAFTNQVGELAEAVNHHPDLCLSRGGCR
jgi:pterin-4a-carbinolamine dehydratase